MIVLSNFCYFSYFFTPFYFFHPIHFTLQGKVGHAEKWPPGGHLSFQALFYSLKKVHISSYISYYNLLSQEFWNRWYFQECIFDLRREIIQVAAYCEVKTRLYCYFNDKKQALMRSLTVKMFLIFNEIDGQVGALNCWVPWNILIMLKLLNEAYRR